MVTYPPALRRTGFGPPRAIRHFAEAIAEARAQDAAGGPPSRAAAPAPVQAIAPGRARRDRVVVRLWLPLTALFVLLAPFALLLAPIFYFAPRPLRPRPYASAFALGRLLLSLRGTDVDVDTPEARVRVRIF